MGAGTTVLGTNRSSNGQVLSTHVAQPAGGRITLVWGPAGGRGQGAGLVVLDQVTQPQALVRVLLVEFLWGRGRGSKLNTKTSSWTALRLNGNSIPTAFYRDLVLSLLGYLTSSD